MKLLDTDLYKITMGQAVWSNFPNVMVKYEFINRSPHMKLGVVADKLNHDITLDLDTTPSWREITMLKNMGFLKSSYMSSLAGKDLELDYTQVKETPDGQLELTIKGPWIDTIFLEVPLLAYITEEYYKTTLQEQTPNLTSFIYKELYPEGSNRLQKKIELLKKEVTETPTGYHPFQFMEFGTRRRFSKDWQDRVVKALIDEAPGFIGTSNIELAFKYGLKCQGTMAHEWIMAFQALSPLHLSQREALDVWTREFRGKLGIALSDTLGLDQFLRDFDLGLALTFSGVRHDSGDPYVWANTIIDYYNSLGIDPMTKTAVFSDSLDFPKAIDLWKTFGNKIRCVFGIGTNLTNDFGIEQTNIVIKMTECEGQPLIKISDSPGKVLCNDEEYKAWAIKLFGRK